MFKRTLFIAGALLACSSLAGAITVVGPYSGTQTVFVGSQVSIDFLYFSDVAQITGFDMAVQYPSFLTYVSANEGVFFSTNGLLGLNPDPVTNPGYITQLFDAAISPDTDPQPAALFTLTFLVNGTGSGSVQPVCDGPNDCTDFPMLTDASSSPVTVDQLNSVTLNALPTPEPSLGIPGAGVILFLVWRRRRVTGSSPA